jgi:hypothetical protein
VRGGYGKVLVGVGGGAVLVAKAQGAAFSAWVEGFGLHPSGELLISRPHRHFALSDVRVDTEKEKPVFAP